MELQTDTGDSGDVYLPESTRPIELSKDRLREFLSDVDNTRTPFTKLEKKYGVARNTLYKYLRNRDFLEGQLGPESQNDKERRSA